MGAEQSLQDLWERVRQRGDLLRLQVIRDYRECCKESGLTYRRRQDWFLSNWDNPEFWAEWEKRFARSGDSERREPSGQIAAEITQEPARAERDSD